MHTIFGIGNPGSSYTANRHNTGFLFLDFFAAKIGIKFTPSKGNFYSAEGSASGIKFLLVKPTTFVNKSGIAAREVLYTYQLPTENLLVICDDTNLNLGTLRVRLSGGDGGHNGLASIIYQLSSNDFPRIRIGVGQNFEKNGLAEYVLSNFNETDLKELKPVFEKTLLLAEEFIIGGSNAMLDLNSKLNTIEQNNNNNL
ncbi:MAG: aminoacyl-tRNA hydrolase [Ignavibacteria bacterium]|nr:aminoacyl-tRNA hydrolase [Ignavibacteria bacterium]MBT8380800.1 aminoacyl-tRNA hydrolase [Ignavibacteria bacterium]MBT8392751.1 aminoacyl-tRNA hydrolase [Ignavibacteria bacterium]NNJ54312.1 aminoacyl-tRNA hydrolase [Ignavibacteriaceae bacterium]NNL22054.1 aminoacyl-tRNA hydrolase [Ignavibacteriaceae bacterium]